MSIRDQFVCVSEVRWKNIRKFSNSDKNLYHLSIDFFFIIFFGIRPDKACEQIKHRIPFSFSNNFEREKMQVNVS